jgi:S-adenosylmethionine:tRNA ribosyltransferase-isomerase
MVKIDDFDYELPIDLIAQEPANPRDSCRLLVVEGDKITHKHFYDLAEMLTNNDVLVINRSRVFPARLLGRKESGGRAEILLISKLGDFRWLALGKGVKMGQRICFADNYFGEIIKIYGKEVEVKLNFGEEVIEEIGIVPLPPYIKSDGDRREEYQTVYAKETGSSAAPTAGLHFSKELLKKLKKKGVEIEEVVLQVGLGTFGEVTTKNIKEKKLHSEFYEIDRPTALRLNEAKVAGKRIIAIGTTSLRVLESVVENGKVQAKRGRTDIFIYPPYRLKFVDSLITNFHLPKSSLVMLVAVILGEKWREVYGVAVKKKYRFFSFGDAMWIR